MLVSDNISDDGLMEFPLENHDQTKIRLQDAHYGKLSVKT